MSTPAQSTPALATPALATPGLSARARTRRVAVAGLIGTTIEWYDFFIYGTAAALVFGPQFFPSASPTASTLAALSAFAIGFVGRPLGGAVMGHFGDRIGRRSMLVLSLVIMGVGTVLIGLLPTYATIGVAAPILLVVFRFAQGFGVGGEWGGATLLALEHAPPSRRTLYSALPQIGLPLGVVLASVVFLVLRVGMDDATFAAWGWRIPFLASAVLVAFGLVLRLRLEESPEFAQVRSQHEVRRAPLLDVLRHPGILVPAAGVSILGSAFGIVLLVFTLSYVATQRLVGAAVMLAISIISTLAWAVAIASAAALAERYGRRPVILAAQVLLILWSFPYFWLVNTGTVGGVLVACVVAGVGVGLATGPYGAFIAEAFPVDVRYSGSSVAYALGGALGGALAPIIATLLFSATGGVTAISIYLVLMGLISVAAAIALRSPHPTVIASQPAQQPVLKGVIS